MRWYTTMTEFDAFGNGDGRDIELWTIVELEHGGVQFDIAYRAIKCARKKFAQDDYSSMYLEKKSGEKVAYKDCWKTVAIEYPKDGLDDFLGNIILPYVFEWMANQLHSRS